MESPQYTFDPEHVRKTQEFLAEHGPCSSRAILQLLNPDDSEEGFRPAIICMLHCPGTWHIGIGEDNGLVGLDSQEKPGDGSEAAAAESLGLVEMMGAWIPRKYLNEDKPRCAVAACHEEAACELAVDGEWFPVCSVHALNRFMPRRELSTIPENAPVLATADNKSPIP